MSMNSQLVFEDRHDRKKNEAGQDLMEIDSYTPVVKSLTSLGEYFQYQVDHQQASDGILKEAEAEQKQKRKTRR